MTASFVLWVVTVIPEVLGVYSRGRGILMHHHHTTTAPPHGSGENTIGAGQAPGIESAQRRYNGGDALMPLCHFDQPTRKD
ncbi:hypothetical protein C3Z06_03310 [Cupriavidus metallidurans]|jgi:hypothetical protein|nr:hypothetical protein C3Z06_03310 [Cupriavidus metallidurans]